MGVAAYVPLCCSALVPGSDAIGVANRNSTHVLLQQMEKMNGLAARVCFCCSPDVPGADVLDGNCRALTPVFLQWTYKAEWPPMCCCCCSAFVSGAHIQMILRVTAECSPMCSCR